MAYHYKTVLRADNYCFDICQNKSNSKEMLILAIHRKENDQNCIGSLNNKTNVITWNELASKFKPNTIKKLESAIL